MSVRCRPTAPLPLARPFGKRGRPRVQEDARGLAGAGRQHHHLGPDVFVAAGAGVHVGDAGAEAVVVGRHLADHGSRAQGEPARLEGRGQEHRGSGEHRMGRAAAPALRAVVAGGAAAVGLGQDRDARGDAGDPQLVAGLLDQELVSPGRGRRQEDAVGLVLQALVGAEQADHAVEPVVVGLDVVVGHRPVVAQAVAAARLEVPGTEAQADAAPVVGAAPQHPAAKPHELAALGHGERLTRDVPAAQGGVELAEGAPAMGGAPAGRVVVPLEHRPVLLHRPLGAGLEQDAVGPRLGERVGGHAAAGAGADDADVVDLRRSQDLHCARGCLSFALPRCARSSAWPGRGWSRSRSCRRWS